MLDINKEIVMIMSLQDKSVAQTTYNYMSADILERFKINSTLLVHVRGPRNMA